MTRTILMRSLVILATVAFAITATIVAAQFALSSAGPATVKAPGPLSGASDAGALDDEARRANDRLQSERAAAFGECPRFSYPARPC